MGEHLVYTGAAQRSLSSSPERRPSDEPCSELVSRRAHHAAPGVRLSIPSPSCPSAPSYSVCKWCYLSQLPPPPRPPARSLAPPFISPMILFSAISESAGPPPPASRPPVCPAQHPWVLLLVAPRPPGGHRSLEPSPNGIDGSETPRRRFPFGRRKKQSLN